MARVARVAETIVSNFPSRAVFEPGRLEVHSIMDQTHAHRFLGAIVGAALLAACSSSSSAGAGDPLSTGGDAGRGEPGMDAGSSGIDAASPDYAALEKQCAGSIGPVLLHCCAMIIPEGVQVLHLAQEDCACGPCASTCDYQECTNLQSPVQACQSCIDGALNGCASQVSAACAANPACAAYQACLAQ